MELQILDILLSEYGAGGVIAVICLVGIYRCQKTQKAMQDRHAEYVQNTTNAMIVLMEKLTEKER